MTLGNKTLLTISATFVGLIAILFVLSQTILLGGFRKLEEDDTRRNVGRALSALETEIKNLSSLNLDWASWDDSYQFIVERNTDYIKSNLNDETLAKQKLNLIMYLDSSGKIVFGKAIDHRGMKEVPLPKDLMRHLAPESPLLRHDDAKGIDDGLIVIDKGILLAAAHPILSSEGKGPVRGTLLMARYLDEGEVRHLGEVTHMAVSLTRYESLFPDGNGAGGVAWPDTIFIRPLSEDLIEGLGVVKDIYDKPAFILKVALPREIFRQGKASRSYFISYLLLAALTSALAITLLLKKNVLTRLKVLGVSVADVGLTGNLAERIPLTGDDELTALSGEVNKMLEALERLEAGRKDAESALRKARDELEARVRERTADLSEANLALKEEITERKRMEHVVKDMAFHDHLTGLPNRLLFIDRLNQVIVMGARHKSQAAVLFLNLDRFKVVNDTLGHAAGDELIKVVAERLKKSLRDGDTVARLGGDEFTVLLQDLAKVEDIPMVLEKVFNSIRESIPVSGHDVFVTASAGVSLYPHDGNDGIELLRNADIAMHHAKGKGGNAYQMYNPAMAEKAFERLTIGNKLRTALERKEFILYYQPQVDLKTGRIIGSEALIRWQDPEKGLVSPAAFIPLAEETGLIVAIGEWGLYEACGQNKKIQQNGFPDMIISVNISARMFTQEGFVETVARVLKDTGLDPRHLMLEITESLLMTNIAEAAAVMKDLKGIGIEFSIDDFGTGYSSLAYLKSLPISQLKIDRSFVQDIADSNDGRLIVTAIIKLGQSLRLDVIAEGVETHEQLEFLKLNQCDKIQGFLFSKPLPAEAFSSLLKENYSEKLKGALLSDGG